MCSQFILRSNYFHVAFKIPLSIAHMYSYKFYINLKDPRYTRTVCNCNVVSSNKNLNMAINTVKCLQNLIYQV